SPPPFTHPLSLHDALPIFTSLGGFAEPSLSWMVAALETPHKSVTCAPAATCEGTAPKELIFAAAGRGFTVTIRSCETAPTSFSRSEEHTSELQSPDHLVCR